MVSCWAIVLVGCILLSIVFKIINLIFVYKNTCQEYSCMHQVGLSILNLSMYTIGIKNVYKNVLKKLVLIIVIQNFSNI